MHNYNILLCRRVFLCPGLFAAISQYYLTGTKTRSFDSDRYPNIHRRSV